MSTPLEPAGTCTRYSLVWLRPGFHDLQDYQFVSEAHARAWLSQPWVTDAEYAVCVTQMRRGQRHCRHCGVRPEHVVSQRRMAVSAFLAMGHATPPADCTSSGGAHADTR